MGMLEFDGHRYLDGRASDPRDLGWMRDAPPPVEKRITIESDTVLQFPQMRWSLSHMRELMPTVNVWRKPGAPSHFERHEKTGEIDALTFTDTNGRTLRFDEALIDNYTDGIVVLHRGRLVYERYFGALEPHLPHACHSVTKSYAGTVAAAFVHEDVLNDTKTVAYYLPELQGTGWEDATLRQVMDMQTGLAYTEVYEDERSGVRAYMRACGWRPRPVGYDGPKTLCDYLQTVRKEGTHGETFDYKTVNTDVMTWVMTRVTGRSFAELLQERLWAPLGCEEDGYLTIDPVGTPLAGAGLSASLRDLARFGELIRCEGAWNGKQVIPAFVVHDVQNGDHPAKLSGGYSYRSQWWVTHDELGAVEARGIHGQRLYIAPEAEMVVVRFASHPFANSQVGDIITTPQMLALGRMLRG
ncbi:serine hydrolase domain-containing protein [Mesorhizobium onobrychidis]|uniref:Serine hydrolase n=1 Tax=Mesorhizobium onobrychidis TaxID=2775404 RepID=A0ABY5QW32_9HYPH|nr:serine hydrolase [Mesorhizobium onobrychidis]UVC15390.1 serine hydrolase [Mesorhizobium onobrychidis]